MKENTNQQYSIWGKWWDPIRKWFYSIWFAYETTIRFYEYSISVNQYFTEQQNTISSYIGNIGAQILNVFCSVCTFVICVIFLTVPIIFILFKFFSVDNLTNTSFEQKLKRIL